MNIRRGFSDNTFITSANRVIFSPVSGEKTTEHISLNSDVGLVSAQDRHSIRLVVKHYFKIYIL